MVSLSTTLPEWAAYWLVSLRFAVVVVAAVAGVWALSDIAQWLRSKDRTNAKLNLTYHLAIICAALSIELASPINHTIIEHIFSFRMSPVLQGVLVMMAMFFVFGFFVLAQVTRLIYRGVRGRTLWLAAGLHTSGIILLIGVGAYFNVYIR